MGKAITPQHHPAVVLRSHYTLVRALLAVAMIAVIGLSAAVVILAASDDSDTVAGSAAPVTVSGPNGATRYDGGPEEGTRGALSPSQAATPPAGIRYDGGPEEGTRAALSPSQPATPPAGIRYDGGPEEGSSHAGQ